MKSNTRLFMINITLTILLAVSLSACEPKAPTQEVSTWTGTALINVPEITITAVAPQATPTLLPTVIPVPTSSPDEPESGGIILLAMKAGGYTQLFAYHPVRMSLTQITRGEWNHADPAISPDGTRLAYCADESGRWDIYILNLVNGEKTRLTSTASYACSPTWSPDGRWMAFEEVLDGRLDLTIRSVVDESTAPVRLTDNGGNNFDPAWSPGGREIAFVSDRNGKLEIWLINLDDPEQRFKPVIRSEDADYTTPSWSENGKSLAWNKINEFSEIESWNLDGEETRPLSIGIGSHPVWMENDEGVLAIVRSVNSNDLAAYSLDPSRMLLPPIHLQNEVTSHNWVSGATAESLKVYLEDQPVYENVARWQPELSTPDTSSGRYDMVYLPDLTAPEPYLIDTVDESFTIMRQALLAELGWDFLKILENASLSVPANASPGLEEDWGYTGRAIDVNMDPLDSGWMVVNREDILGRTYWRVWLKCRQQDGTCGVCIQKPVWDFESRITGGNSAYENGGMTTTIPQGYWIDFTSFALDYGWERLPAGANWRSYFPETRINQFVLREELSWQDAMRERFTSETINSYWPTP